VAPLPFTVRRWKRFGHDRLYVDRSDGTTIGWLSLTTGELSVADSANYDHVIATLRSEHAATHWLAELETECTQAPVADEPVGDLATNRPGEGLRARADRQLDAMRTQSRFGTALARFFDVKTDERAWRKGAEGEEAVGPRLERLAKDGWRVLHSVPVGDHDADIDHVLVGPGGVYTINTKFHPGKRIWVGANSVRINGQSVPYLRKSRHEATRASRLVSRAAGRPIAVRAVLVLLTGSVIPNITIKEQPADVLVLNRMDIPRTFRRSRRCLDDTEIAELFQIARRPNTWI
jgi:hypothetical protein